MIVPVMAISNLVLTQQIYSEETNGAHAHYREPVPLSNNDSNSNENVKKAVGLITKTTTLHVNRLFIHFLAVVARL